MKALRLARKAKKLTQRDLARKASLSFKGLQLLEKPGHDARLSSLRKAAKALGLPGGGIFRVVGSYLMQHPDSIAAAAFRILEDGKASWKIHLMNFVDAFRNTRDPSLIASAPTEMLEARIRCLMASTVERLCRELEQDSPCWCAGIGPLPEPWFVAGVENLKALALMESFAEFRKRNIFVLGNFLDRA